MTAPRPKCIACEDRGWFWGRTTQYEKGRMIKRPCKFCKAGEAFKARITAKS